MSCDTRGVVIWWLALNTWAATATLHVAVHRQAGGVYDIAADGADGLCVASPATIRCPASGPVHFRWAGSDEFALTGATEVAPGEVGVAFVLAVESSRHAERSSLASGVTPDTIYVLFAPAPGVQPPIPSPGMVADLARLGRHPNPLVRRAVVDAMMPFWRHTASDPFPYQAPELLPVGLIATLSRDPDTRVRRRLAAQLKELRTPDSAQNQEAQVALLLLVDDPKPPVQRAATNSLKMTVTDGRIPPVDAWHMSMVRAARDGPPGRAAAGTLIYLAGELEPSPQVVPVDALNLVIGHHPERGWAVWYAWREHILYDHHMVMRLLEETMGLHRGLLKYWAQTAPDDLAVSLRAWEAGPPHSERFQLARKWLSDVHHSPIRIALGLPAAPPMVLPESE